MAEQDIRQAAENFIRSQDYGSINNQTSADISHSHSINTIASIRPEYVISQELFAGQSINGRMSSVRRFFCLFVTFDLLFSCLVWLICVMSNGDNFMTALKKQIFHYDIHSSLFDVVAIAMLRFLVLMLFYGIISINHWIVIAISTTSTCAFLIAKVFVYDFQAANQSVLQVLLVLISFVLSWGEAWFLDFRVIPQEYHASQYLVAGENERAPLVRSYVQGLPSMCPESVGNFYSPLGSAEPSLHSRDSPNPNSRYTQVRLSEEAIKNYKALAIRSLNESWILHNSEDWKDYRGSMVQYMILPKQNRIFKLIGTVQISPRYLLDELFYNVHKIPLWNPDLLESSKVQTIDENTDITYQVSADGAGGVVASRDFVNLRHWAVIDNCYVIACVATEHPSFPKNNRYIRGENGASCMVIRPLPVNSEECQFEWVLNTNLKGWIPQYILDVAYANMMQDYLKNLRKYIKTKEERNKPM